MQTSKQLPELYHLDCSSCRIKEYIDIPDGEKELGEEEGEDDPGEVLLGPRLDARPLQLDLQPRVVQQGEGHHRLQDLVPVGGEREQS